MLPTPITLNHQTTNPYEAKYGYSRSVRRGPFIFVSGTTSIDLTTSQIQYPNSAHQQALTIFAEIIRAIEAVGGKKRDIVRVRMFVKFDEDCDEVGRALKETLGGDEEKSIPAVDPTATMITGVRFVHPDMRVEIEAEALVM
ncbi:YjgF-like protein [Pluteus cervinus]|uniref:YjgF-like protein n=1 Tax=Pluteus cervinus TaxID=181527 RepID=A0ACD3BDR5_9AGAR|nr:YjgF-like protein [Pluteus cervinus]